ncbi:MAG: SET domain-containing protein [Candidatus Staskawiczbacteria bacterium]|jgi:SET domain-containing protein
MKDTKIKKNILNNLKATYCCIMPSQIHGVGVFALKDIPKNQNPFRGVAKLKWYKFKISDFKDFGKDLIGMIDGFWGFEKNGEIWIPEFGLNGMDISFFLNNSKKPNVKTIDKGTNFLTLRKIKKGEELTVFYGTYDWKYEK